MNFDPTTVTDAYISGLGEEALALVAAYTAGNHWILLWGIIVPMIVTAILVRTRLLERIAQPGYSPMDTASTLPTSLLVSTRALGGLGLGFRELPQKGTDLLHGLGLIQHRGVPNVF